MKLENLLQVQLYLYVMSVLSYVWISSKKKAKIHLLNIRMDYHHQKKFVLY